MTLLHILLNIITSQFEIKSIWGMHTTLDVKGVYSELNTVTHNILDYVRKIQYAIESDVM